MTCRCKAEFCYECGKRCKSINFNAIAHIVTCPLGKSCTCAAFTEESLTRAAEDRVAAVFGRTLTADPQVQRVRMEQARRFIAETHECQHSGRFGYVGGGGQCAMCNYREWLSGLLPSRCTYLTSNIGSKTCEAIFSDVQVVTFASAIGETAI